VPKQARHKHPRNVLHRHPTRAPHLRRRGPVASEAVRQVRRGPKRTYGAAPRRLARPLSVDDIRQIISGIDRNTAIGIRDAAIILLGHASATRRAELVALALTDVEHKPAAVLLTVRRSRMTRTALGRLSQLAHGKHAATDPVAALNACATWGDVACLRPAHQTRRDLSGRGSSHVLNAPREAP
jgi:site-specific recombinase XerC